MNALLLAALAATAASPRLGDNVWMWGHDTGHYDGPVNYARHDYKIPWSAPITMADACVENGTLWDIVPVEKVKAEIVDTTVIDLDITD